MTLSLQDRRLMRAHRDFDRAVDGGGALRPALLLIGVLRGVGAIGATAIAARRMSDPIGLRPRVLQR